MKAVVVAALLLCSLLGLGTAVDLQARYPFSVTLLDRNDQYYALYWNFTRSTESIYFAVNVSTTGWVGFGLSPSGQMPSSDVVIGWVSDDGTGYFHDRYASGRELPPIDSSQDWFLISSEEANGFTVLEFSRNFTTCDAQDRDITGSTARVIWSFNANDPTDSMGSDAMYHGFTQRGTTSLNLLGGQPVVNRAVSDDEPSLNFTVNEVTIPSASTTYWCESFRLPEQLRTTVHYINKFAPKITPHARSFVHHIIVYQCPGALSDEEVGLSMPCDDLTGAIELCRQGFFIGGWAVGGEAFTFPEGIGYPVGGSGLESQQYALIEMHYDNPDMTENVVDSSGMRFFYTTEEPEQLAGSISLGHDVTPFMIIPPGERNFTITGSCSADCTRISIPPTGIRLFSNNFHTHLAGHGVTLQHFRMNEECGVLEELEPIEQNLGYDFNFQQTNYLPQERLVLPGDILTLKCFYNTMDRENLTLGGESTREEMCLTFGYYYPRPAGSNILDGCSTTPTPDSFSNFYNDLVRVDPEAAARFASEDPLESLAALHTVDWRSNPSLGTSLRNSFIANPSTEYCVAGYALVGANREMEPQPVCPYIAPDKCSDTQPLSCCERIGATTSTPTVDLSSAPPTMKTTMGLGSFVLLLATLMTLLY